ncbi:MAG TPA: hypothetical protein VNG34_11220 [Actinomycetota bacterium]|nr:hypothetical protein [Actinomycetota bacterium]
MPEGANVEIAKHLNEHGSHSEGGRSDRFGRILEIFEAILLACVAIATAWSGYQSAKWDGRSAEQYAEASKLRVEQDLAATQAGQQLLFNTNALNAWVTATTTGDDQAAAVFAKRFTPNYAVAFDAWLKTDPLTEPDAPAGPSFMPEYHSPLDDKAADLDEQATHALEQGGSSRDTGEEYVRVTVFLAMVLFLIAMSQRFKIRNVRLGLIGLAVVFTGFALTLIFSFPHL